METLAETHTVRVLENSWIPMRDGVRLAARIWLPEDAELHPVPAVLEYIPYRKRDLTRVEDDALQPFIAKRGFAVARVDIRGTGDSEGVLYDEYTEQEQQDALEVIDWLAAQGWCTGKVGMKGISWGGINALQVAALNPEPLEAIVSYCSTDHRFRTDAHFLGGVLTRSNFDWGAWFQVVLALPPDPGVVGEGWKAMWHERLEKLACPVAEWLKHQYDDEFWRRGSVDRGYDKISCPVYAVSGFVDAYTDTVPSLLENLRVPRKGLIGAWGHNYPDRSEPGPAIGFLQEEVRWWNHWLKGIDTGIMEEPMLTAYMGESTPAQSYPEDVPGRWIAEPLWPSARLTERCFYLAAESLTQAECAEQRLSLEPDESVGLQRRYLLPMFMENQLPTQQQEDDAKSLSFDSGVLAENCEVLGAPQIRLKLSVDRPVAKVAVRLQEVDRQGVSWNITSGYLNLNLKEGFDKPQPLVPGEQNEISLALGFIAHCFSRGNRIRISISEAYWPKLYPSPEPVRLALYTGSSQLILPVRPVVDDNRLENLQLPLPLRGERELTQLEPANSESEVIQNGRIVSVTDRFTSGKYRIDEINTLLSQSGLSHSSFGVSKPAASEWVNQYQVSMKRDNWDIRVEVASRLETVGPDFKLRVTCHAYEQNELVFDRGWDEEIPRLLVARREER